MTEIDTVYRDHVVKGDIHSGAHEPDKAEIRSLLKQIQNAGGQAVTRNTLTALQAVTPPNENYMGVVLDDTDVTKNGYYSRVSSAWVWERGFPDTFGRLTLSGTGTARTASVAAGVNPADIEVFFAVVNAANSGAITLSVSGGTARDVVNAAGNALSPGEWTGVVLFFLNSAGDYQLINDAGAAASAAASASAADADRIAAELAADEAQAEADRAESYAAAAGAASGLVDRKTVALLLSDTVLSYTAGEGKTLVAPGDVITAQGFRYEVAASGASDHHIATAGGVKLYALQGQDGYSILQWGAVADVDMIAARTDWTGFTDNTATLYKALSDIIARDGGGTLYVPTGCLANYADFDADYPGMCIIDDSHLDYSRPAIVNQVTTYRRKNTVLGPFGAWNGNVEGVDGNHNPGFVIQNRGVEGTISARSSLVYWHGNAQADFQLVYDRAVSGAPKFSMNSYGPLVDGTGMLAIAGQGHAQFRQWAVNTDFYAGATVNWFVAGHTTDADYLTKAFLEVYGLPNTSSGDFTKLFRVGTTIKARQYVKNDGAFEWWPSGSGTPRVVLSASGALTGAKKGVRVLTTSATLSANDSGQHVTNVDIGGGVVLTLPAAVVGLHFTVSVDAAQNLRVDPNGTDQFVGKSAGKYMESSSLLSECSLVCIKTGVWNYRRSGTWTDEA